MRIGVIGAGAMGGTIAALLDRGGHEVEVTARGEHLRVLRAQGLHLTGVWGEHIARVAAADTLDGSPELVVLATKATDADAALRANADALRGVPLIVLQNGLDGLRVAEAAAPDSPVIGALSLIAASYLTPGEIAVTTGLPTYLGRAAGADRAPVEAAAAVLGAVMPIRTVDDIASTQWTKLIINHVNAMPAITGMPAQEVIAIPGLRRILTASMRESIRIAHTIGVRFAAMSGLSDSRLRLVERAPLWLGENLPKLMARQMGSVPNPGSTLQSIRRGQLTEIDALNGAVVRVAAEHGLTAPINAAITEMVHEVERTGAFIPADRVVRRVRVT